MPQIDSEQLEEVLREETDLEDFKISRVIVLAEYRMEDERYEGKDYILFTAMTDSGLGEEQIDSIMDELEIDPSF